MIRKQHIALAGTQLALLGILSCSSDANVVIHPSAGAAGVPTATAGAGGDQTTPAAGGTSGDLGGSGAPVTTAGSGGTPADLGGSGGGIAVAGAGGAPVAGSGGTGGMPAGGSAAICTPSGAQFDCGNVLKSTDATPVSMDGYANTDLADGPSTGSDAHQFNCVASEGNPKIYKEKHWQLAGPTITAGKNYKVDLHFYGVVECKNYLGGTGPATTDNDVVSTTVSHNLWMTGVTDNGDHWNTYTFTITPASSNRLVGIGPQTNLPDLMKTYVINRCPKAKQADHYTFRLDFDSSITVPANSFINYVEYDTNCRMIANCGAANAGQSCNPPYNLVDTVTQAVPNTNALTLNQPLANNASPPSRGQWWLVDVKNITALP